MAAERGIAKLDLIGVNAADLALAPSPLYLQHPERWEFFDITDPSLRYLIGTDGLFHLVGSSGTVDATARTAAATAQATANAAYVKPGTGVPKTDLAAAVQTSLGKADNAYVKPGSGVPGSDMTAAVQASLAKADSALQTADISGKAAKTQTFSTGAFVATVADGDLMRIRVPFALTVIDVYGKSVSGTCSLTTKNGVSSIGTPVAAAATEGHQAYTSANTFAAGDYLVVTASANAACVGLSIGVNYTRVLG